MACPLWREGHEAPVGVVGIALMRADSRRAESATRQLAEAAGRLALPGRLTREAPTARMGLLLELAALVLEHQRLQPAATALATALATRLGCTRVSLGFSDGTSARVLAISHSARFDHRTEVVRLLGAAMDDALDQRATVVHPAPDLQHVRPCHGLSTLAQRQGASAVCAIPFTAQAGQHGALLLERDTAFDVDTIELLEHLCSVSAPMLELMRQNERSMPRRIADELRRFGSALLGPRRLGLKAATAAVVAAVLVLGLARVEHRVAADARIEGRIQRAVVAPVDGFIGAAQVRAGDTVRAGDLLATLDDRDLVIERRGLLGEREQIEREYRSALAAHDRRQSSVLSARIEQADARLALIDAQLARVQLTAPIDGIVVAGDLSQSLGSPVNRGDTLFEIAPLDDWRVVLEVDERDVAALQPGQQGTLTLSALPGDPLPVIVGALTPVAHTRAGRSVYRIDASLSEQRAALRPGMQGVGKITVGRRSLAWIWSHRVLERLRLALWRWWP